jgi:glucose/arabinose dehydrogenase
VIGCALSIGVSIVCVAVPIAPAAGRRGVRLALVAKGLRGSVFVVPAPSGLPGRIYVVEKAGRIMVVDRGRILPRPFLDICMEVAGGELRGLFSMAFHPDYLHNGKFFVNYVGRDGDIYVTQFRAVHGVVSLSSRRVLLRVPTGTTDPDAHYGGQVEFGRDGRLYVSFGDAGRPDTAQDASTLLGKLVRLQVDAPGVAPKIVAFGQRNPWRFSFDRATGDLYIGDVGNIRREEVDRLPSGFQGIANFGWPVWEGSIRLEPDPENLPGQILPPFLEYSHSAKRCYSVIGGPVYRGRDLPTLTNRYLFADLCGGVWSVSIRGGAARDRRSEPLSPVPPAPIVSFGTGSHGELYLVTLNGHVYQVSKT